MAENTVKVDISFQSLLEAISSLAIAEKHQLWELLEAELFPDDEDSPEDTAICATIWHNSKRRQFG